MSVGCDRTAPAPEQVTETSQELSSPYQAPEGGDTGAAAPLPFPSNDWSCDLASAERAQAWIDATRPAAESQTLRDIAPLSPTRQTPRILIGISDSTLSLLRRDFNDDLSAAADALRQAQQQHSGGEPPAIAFRIDGPTSAERMKSVLTSFRNELGDSVLFVVPAPAPVERAAPPNEDAIRRAAASGHLANPQTCPAVDLLIERVATRPPDESSAAVRNELVDAWMTCECQPDLEALLAKLIWPAPGRQPVLVGQISTEKLQTMLADEQPAWTELSSTLR
ncbi:hypothetical protein DV096_16185 [Bradymonadaceae bacterium TMQ3]|uniref:Uncharacterized protein n=1 Tax=Lujinxingia sediminis TaxID=2480984 RepID=A0ABY0CQS0_9DELT|nr:hypothetical protein [Lujinxingia sediminis]RDV37046.1 hypothetical protein DV096_16185 [Bradymonadaceae bacterium TMQ3]RVU42872.1 hypothetical protein EA187_13610 [Lujinxingia sediminis]TXC73171.1 hypothetical protein FRC91_17130 [Bradymonadales bacterium TMQ1]